MKQIQTFKEFANFSSPIDEQTRETIIALAESHPLFMGVDAVKKIVNDHKAPIVLDEIAQINLVILERNTILARRAESADEDQRFLILAEMSLLNTASSALSASISARMQQSVYTLSNILKIKG